MDNDEQDEEEYVPKQRERRKFNKRRNEGIDAEA